MTDAVLSGECEKGILLCVTGIGMSMTAAICVFAKKAVRERRIPFELTADPDPFYSEENMKRLRASIAQMESSGGTIHEVNYDKSMD